MPTDPHRPLGVELQHDIASSLHEVPPAFLPGQPAPDRPRASAIPQEWVDTYLQQVERRQGARVAREIGKQLGLFLDYAERSNRGAVRLPWWEYSLALEWLNERTRGFRLTLAQARAFLDTLHDFYQALVADGHLQDCWDLDQARDVLCGGR